MEKKLFFKIYLMGTMALGIAGCMSKPIPKDPYTWLEEVNSEPSLAWVKTYNQKTFDQLQVHPEFEKIRSESLAIMSATDKIPFISFYKNSVYNFWMDQKNPRGLYRRTTYEEYKKKNPKWELLLDVDKLGRDEKKSWVYRGCQHYRPEFPRCLVSLSNGGKDASEIREFDLQTKSFVKGGFFLPEAKSSATWLDQDTILISTDFGPGSMTESGYPREVRLLKRGQDFSQAQKIFTASAKDMRAYAFTEVEADSQTTFVAQEIDFFHRITYWMKSPTELVKIEIPDSAEFQGYFKDEIYFSLRQDWKDYKAGMLLKAPLEKIESLQVVYAPSPKSSFENIYFTKDDTYITVLENVNKKVYKFGSQMSWESFPQAAVGNTWITSADSYSNRALFAFENPVTPTTLFEWNSKGLKKIKSLPARFDSRHLVVEQYEAKSFDGTMIPYFLIRDRRKIGPQPTLMTAYGGFQISLHPYYEGVLGKVWLAQGGQYVIANIRGGGEFGPKWHEAALKQNRQVAYNDLFAVTEDLQKRGFTNRDKLALMGGSNGGLMAGVALTQRPELYKAIIINVPLLDMMRYNKLHAGASWVSEYGNPDLEKEREYLIRYSPYQNLQPHRNYPAVLLTTSTYDDRVHPGHARKFGAKMDEYKIPFYYFENTEGGHAVAADMNQRAKFIALYYSFLYEQIMGRGKHASK